MATKLEKPPVAPQMTHVADMPPLEVVTEGIPLQEHIVAPAAQAQNRPAAREGWGRMWALALAGVMGLLLVMAAVLALTQYSSTGGRDLTVAPPARFDVEGPALVSEPDVSIPGIPAIPSLADVSVAPIPAMPDMSMPAMPEMVIPAMPDLSITAMPALSIPSIPEISIPAVELPSIPTTQPAPSAQDSSIPAFPDMTIAPIEIPSFPTIEAISVPPIAPFPAISIPSYPGR